MPQTRERTANGTIYSFMCRGEENGAEDAVCK